MEENRKADEMKRSQKKTKARKRLSTKEIYGLYISKNKYSSKFSLKQDITSQDRNYKQKKIHPKNMEEGWHKKKKTNFLPTQQQMDLRDKTGEGEGGIPP